MRNLIHAQAQQLTLDDGSLTEWVVTLDGEELYRLPSHFTVQETFIVRAAAMRVAERRELEVRAEAEQLAEQRINQILKAGNQQLEALRDENERLADIIEKITNQQEVA